MQRNKKFAISGIVSLGFLLGTVGEAKAVTPSDIEAIASTASSLGQVSSVF